MWINVSCGTLATHKTFRFESHRHYIILISIPPTSYILPLTRIAFACGSVVGDILASGSELRDTSGLLPPRPSTSPGIGVSSASAVFATHCMMRLPGSGALCLRAEDARRALKSVGDRPSLVLCSFPRAIFHFLSSSVERLHIPPFVSVTLTILRPTLFFSSSYDPLPPLSPTFRYPTFISSRSVHHVREVLCSRFVGRLFGRHPRLFASGPISVAP